MDANQDTALHCAACLGSACAVATLLAAAARVDLANAIGDTPLHIAAGSGHAEDVGALLAVSAPVDVSNKSGETPLGGVVNSLETSKVRLARMKGTMEVLRAWDAAVPANVASSRSWTGKRTSLRTFLIKVPLLTQPEREAAKSEWQTTAAQLVTHTVVPPSAADRALASLQAVYDTFGSDPARLTTADVHRVVTGDLIKDVRCLLCAHQILVLADDVGLFKLLTTQEVEAQQIRFYHGIYEPMLMLFEPGYHLVVHAILLSAAKRRFVDQHHVSCVTAGLKVHAASHHELRKVYMRLSNLEAAMDNLSWRLFHTVKELRCLHQSLRDKEERERKLTLIKSAVKIGASLVPLAGGVPSVTVDVVAAMEEGATGASAVFKLPSDPADMKAAVQMFRCVRDAKGVPFFELAAILLPYESMGAVVEDLEVAAGALGIDVGSAVDGVASGKDGEGDEWGKVTDVTTDEIIEHSADWVSGRGCHSAFATSFTSEASPVVAPDGNAPDPGLSPATQTATPETATTGPLGMNILRAC